MTELRRQMMLRVADGVRENLSHVYHLDRLTRCDEILAFMLREKITGQKFAGKVKNEHGGSLLDFVKWVVQKLNRDLEKRPIIAGRDFRIH
jgi:hypothetical protein